MVLGKRRKTRKTRMSQKAGMTPLDDELIAAIRAQNTDGVKSALGRGANPNAANTDNENKTVSEYAFGIRDPTIRMGILQDLIKAGLNLTTRSAFSENPPLINAVHTEDPKLVQMLIDAGAPIDATGSEGGTALYWAADNMPSNDTTSPEAVKIQTVIKILLKAGANPQLVYDNLKDYPEALNEVKKKIEAVRNPKMAIEVGVKKDLPPFIPSLIRGFLGGKKVKNKTRRRTRI